MASDVWKELDEELKRPHVIEFYKKPEHKSVLSVRTIDADEDKGTIDLDEDKDNA